MKNYYHILGLPNLVSTLEVRAAYRKLALVHHPDRGGDQEKMKEINEAYEFLTKHKEEYDQQFRPRRPQVVRTGFTIIVGGFGKSWEFNGATSTGNWSSTNY